MIRTVAEASLVVVSVVVVVLTTLVTNEVDTVVGTMTTLVLVDVATVVAGITAVALTVEVVTEVDVSATEVDPPPFTVVLEKVVVGSFTTVVVESDTVEEF